MPSDLDAIAAELCALPPAQFTAARNARVGVADRDIAAQVKALRKPTVAAWAVNLLAREGALGDALELAAALREAQDDLDAAELSRLGRQRRQLVAALAAQAVALAGDAGVSVSAAARDDVEKTINAAVMDAAAAAAVMTARLVSPLEAGAFEPDDLAEAVAGSLPGSLPGAPAPPPRDDLAARRARRAAEKSAREAERAANEAERALARIEARRATAQERADHLAERIDDLRRDLARLEDEAASAESKRAVLERERDDAATAARIAAREAERAQRALGDF